MREGNGDHCFENKLLRNISQLVRVGQDVLQGELMQYRKPGMELSVPDVAKLL